VDDASGQPAIDTRQVTVRRSAIVQTRPVGSKEAGPVLSCQYYVCPSPGTEDHVALMTMMSPTTGQWPQFRQLFDAIASTFMFTWASEVGP